jgi:hypothetical protein
MTVVIALKPNSIDEGSRGVAILDALEERFEIEPDHVVADGTRRYAIDDEDADVDVLDPDLDRIDRDWRSHLTTWRD